MATDKNAKKRFWFIPPKRWQLPAAVAIGAMIGLGFYAIHLSRLTSYMSDDPKACINCHVMTPHYMTWENSSHREVASCNDCHVPHNNVFNKYFFKAKDGAYHSYVFTTRTEPEVIRAKEASVEVIHNNCIRCHIDQVTDAKTEGMVAHHTQNRTERLCWECHRGVPHGRVKSLSSVGYLIEPTQYDPEGSKNAIPKWLEKETKKNDNKK